MLSPRSPCCVGALAVVTAACGAGPAAPTAPRPPSTSTSAVTGSAPTTGPTATSRPCIDLARWTSDRLARQLVAVPALDFDLPDLRAVMASGVGGVLFLGSAPAPADLGALVGQADAASPERLGLLVMADQEGGGIQRLSPVVEGIPWPRDMAASMTPVQVSTLGARVGAEMRAAGVNVDLAPVLDVDGGAGPSATDPDGRRSFSATAATAGAYGLNFSGGLRRGGVIPVVKHFPGLGGASGNSDNGAASTRPIASLRTTGLAPFRAAVAADAPAVMVANASVPGLTSVPASLSSAVIRGLLRGELGYGGLVMTDSLSAGAIRSAGYDVPGAAVAAVEAGADMVLFGSTLTSADTAQLRPAAVLSTTDAIARAAAAAVDEGRLPISRLRQAAGRVLALRGGTVCRP